MDDESLDIRLMTKSRDLDDYDILSIQSLSAAVPHKTTESFRHFIWAAMATYAFGNKSIDHVMKQYDSIWQRYKTGIFEKNPRILLLREMVEKVEALANRLENTDVGDSLNRICAKASLIRLEASFKSAYGLIRKEYLFESSAVIRLILEQLGWAYTVSSSDQTEISNINPTKCISNLKNIFPDAGKLYGELSEWAHIDPSFVSDYERFHKENIPVVRRSDHNSLLVGVHLMCLSVVYINTVQKIYKIFEADSFEDILDSYLKMFKKYQALNENVEKDSES